MQRVQLIVAQRIDSCIWTPPNQKPGDVVWVSRDAAKHLLENGLCKWPQVPQSAPDDPATPAPQLRPARPVRHSDGFPLDRFAIVDPVWKDETAICIAGGPSLTQGQLACVEGRRRVIAINDAYLVAPWADICYFADARWWKWHSDGLAKSWPWAKFNQDEVKQRFATFAGQKVSIDNTGMMVADPAVFILRNHGSDELSEKPNGLHTGSNSGYQAINLAVLAGAKRILLLGYDMKYSGGRSHSHNGHPQKMPESVYLGFARTFNTMRPQLDRLGVDVINCTPGSAIQAFPKAELASVLPDPA